MLNGSVNHGIGRSEVLARLALVAAAVLLPGLVPAADVGFTSPLVIPAAEFESSGVWNFGTQDRFSNTYGYVSSHDDELTCLMAPVILPNGVTITEFEAAVSDLIVGDPGSASTCAHFYPDVQVSLMSTHYDDVIYPQDTHVITHASVTSTLDNGQTHVVSDISISEPYVNNIFQSYWVRVYLCGDFEGFQAVRIHYEE